MKIIHNRASGIISEAVRLRLQRTVFQDADSTTRTLNTLFPRQLVSAKNGRILVTKEDGSIVVAILQDGRSKTNWVESAVNLRMTLG